VNELHRSAEQVEKSKRRWSRYHVEMRLKITLSGEAQGLSFHGTGTNISKGGMRVFVPRDLKMGESVTLDLPLPYTKERLVVRAVVRNRDGFHYGVEFVNITARDQEMIARNCGVLALLQ
jgi:c-di-GMP-binding flagellar brake protein YcgR